MTRVFVLIILLFGLQACKSATIAMNKSDAHDNLEECLEDYANSNFATFSADGAWSSCENQIQAFLENPGFEYRGGTDRGQWNQAMKVFQMTRNSDGSKNNMRYLTHGPIIGKWWAIQ